MFCTFLLLLLLSGCSMGEELTEWAAGKANDTLEVIGGGVQEALDDIHNAEHQGGPFENNLESARAYLLTQLQEKYGIEFTVVGDEDLTNYGAFAGATYTCDVAPIDAPEQVTTALVSQTMYQDVRDKMLSLYNTNFTDCRMLLKLPKLEEVDLRFCPLEHEEVLQTLDIRQVGLAKEQQ